MKIRNGFVSNSSSSSFVLLLPEDFDTKIFVTENEPYYDLLEDIEYDGDDEEKFTKEKSIEIINEFRNDGSFYEYEDHIKMNLIVDMLKDYIIFRVDSGPDSGNCELMTESEIKKIKNILKIKN